MKERKAAVLNIPLAGGDSGLGRSVLDACRAWQRTAAFDEWLLKKLLHALHDPLLQIVLWDGKEISTARAGAPIARLVIRDRAALYSLVAHPSLHFGDLYSAGRIEVEGNLVEFLEMVYRALPASAPAGLFRKQLAHRINRPRHNTLSGSRANIHHHYDIGNDFYRLWLDEHMQYTCAYFSDPQATLEAAQLAKMDHVCRKLRLRPGETVVEAGCGWGGLARHMARYYGVRVKSFNISHEQITYARERAAQEGLAAHVEFIEDDYRNITGKFDAFVSVGMLEHVGVEHYRELGAVIDRCLSESGRGLIHSIGRNKAGPMNAWIEKRIFPGAYPPSLREMMEIFEPWEFSVLDVENLRLHYAKTLEHWLARFENHSERVTEMFDAVFVRAWRLYLSGSIAAFTTGALQLFQVLFARPRHNEIPWTRAHLYE